MFTSSVPRSSSILDNHDAAFWLLSSAAIFPRSLTRSLLTIVPRPSEVKCPRITNQSFEHGQTFFVIRAIARCAEPFR